MPGSLALFSFGTGSWPPRRATASSSTPRHTKPFCGDVLDAERAHALRADALIVQVAAVVIEHALGGDDADVAGTVELGADLAELGRHVLVVVDELLAAERPPVGRPGMMSFQLREPNAGASEA